MLNVTIVCGNPKAGSRTLHIAEALVARLLDPALVELRIIDLAEHTAELFAWPSETMSELTAPVAASDLLVVCSPTYKASYTGLLKSFLDRYAADGLAGVVAVPVMTGGDATHSLAPDTTLRPLLVELGASTPTKSLYFQMGDMDALDARIDAWVVAETARLQGTAALAPALRALEEVPA